MFHSDTVFLEKVRMGNAKNHKRKSNMPIDHRDQLSSFSDPQSASDRKLNFSHVQDSISDSDSESEGDVDQIHASGNGYRMWDWSQLQSLISSGSVCKVCRVNVMGKMRTNVLPYV